MDSLGTKSTLKIISQGGIYVVLFIIIYPLR